MILENFVLRTTELIHKPNVRIALDWDQEGKAWIVSAAMTEFPSNKIEDIRTSTWKADGEA